MGNLFRKKQPPVAPPVVPEIEYPEITDEVPELTEEEIAKNRLRTTGPVVTGARHNIAATITAPTASPNIVQPKPINQDFNAPLAAGREKQQRMVQQPVSAQPAGFDNTFAQQRGTYFSQEHMPEMKQVQGTSIQAPETPLTAPGQLSIPDSTGQAIAGIEKQQRMVQQPSVNTGVQPSGNAQQQEKMQGIESKQAYDEAGAASRIAAGQERVDRTVQPQQPAEQPAANTISDKQNAVQPAGNELLMDKNGNFIGVYGVTQPGDNTQKPTVDAGAGWMPYANTPEQQEYINNGGAMLGDGKAVASRMAAGQEIASEGQQPVGGDHYAGVYQDKQNQPDPQDPMAKEWMDSQQKYIETFSRPRIQQPVGNQDGGTQPVPSNHYAGVYENGDQPQDGAPTFSMDANGNLVDDKGNVVRQGDITDNTNQGGKQGKTKKNMPIIDSSDSHSGMNALLSLVDDEDKLKRDSVTNRRILALGDALRQIGNIYHTVHGAPSQQFNNPVQEEAQRYQQEKAIRDNDRYKKMAAKQSAAMNELKRKQMEYENEYRNESIKLRKAEHDRLVKQSEETERNHKALEELKRQAMENKKLLDDKKISIQEYQSRSARINALANQLRASKYQPGGGGGSVGSYTTVTTVENKPIAYDAMGNPTKYDQTRTTTRVGKGGGTNLNLSGASNTDNMNLGLH